MSHDHVAYGMEEWLKLSNRVGVRMNGIIYVHDISKVRIQGSAHLNMRVFRRLCGEDGLAHVILVSAFWDTVAQSLGEEREHELATCPELWAGMVAEGSELVRVRPDRPESYLRVLEKIARRNHVELSTQAGPNVQVNEGHQEI